MDELADAFVEADLATRDLIERTVERFNAVLRDDPGQLGESRHGRERVALDAPCGIYFTVDDPMPGVVRVTAFWTF